MATVKTEPTKRDRWLKAHAQRHPLLFEVRLDVMADDWDGAMCALGTISDELSWRNLEAHMTWSYSPPACIGDYREKDAGLFQPCDEASDAELLYAGKVLARYTDMLERIRPRG